MEFENVPSAQVAPRPRGSLVFWFLLAGGGGVVLFLVCAGLCGAGIYRGMQGVNEVSRRVDEIFVSIEEDQFDSVYDNETATAYRQVTTKEQNAVIGKVIRERLGKLQSKSAQGFNSRSFNGKSQVTTTYNAQFEKGKGTIKTTFFWEEGKWKLAELRVESPVLLAAKCPHCGATQSVATAKFCSGCGKELPAAK